MPRDLRLARRRATTPVRALAGLVIAASATGCGAGFEAQTQAIYDPAAGVSVRTGNVYALNALFVANDDGTATLSVSLLDRFGDGDELTAVTASTPDGEPVEVTQNVKPLPLCSGQLAILGGSAAVTISGDNVLPGGTLELTLTFADAEPIRAQVPVVTRDDAGTYDGVAQSPAAEIPAPQPCPSQSLTPSASAPSSG